MPEEVDAFLQSNWGALNAMARTAAPDEVLVTWMGQKELVIYTTPRLAILNETPDDLPPEALKGPLPLSPGADVSLWVLICKRYEDGTENIFWCSMDFMPPSPAEVN